jgi:hypothetical protein
MDRMNKILKRFSLNYSALIIWLFVPIVVITSFSHHRWVDPGKVFEWDVKSYYAYLPATFIHHDLSLSFIGDNPKEYSKWFWPVTTPKGKKCIVTSMGMSILYSPFFFIAHGLATITGYPTDGYSVPYAFAIHFSALFYLIVGLFFLRKLLLKYFSQVATTITIIVVFAGTNLFYYTAYAAAMSHCYNFALICVFLFYVDKWHQKNTVKSTFVLGLLSGLIALIRPTNILVLLILFFWECASFKDIAARIRYFLTNYKKVLLMIFSFVIVWVPQFLYWKYVSGKFLYFSYAGIDGKFFWSNPQVFDILFSYRKGWWVYTPVMFIATLGIILMIFKHRKLYLGILIFLVLNIYVQSSWWCWWFGGSFGLRAFIDSYGIMAIPLAAVINESLRLKIKGYLFIGIIGLLTWYNTFQIRQLNHNSLHYWWMSRYGYWNNFLNVNTAKGYWESVPVPDYPKARKGVYVAKNLITRFNGYENIKVTPEEIVSEIKQSIVHKPKYDRYAQKFNISVDSAITIEAWNEYERNYSLDEYIRPLVAKQLSDSLANDTIFLNSSITNWKTLPKEELEQVVLNKANEQIKNEKF